ncbi:superoxide dismutase family protein [Virgibacillus sp. NKC19-3]|uniref:superoxide dismutase family protein n=1 Tax=Virgibacillus saliphilus TaxID=2831674 RepID=UPI001C9A8938|nr:superoxide dismutase family protein [Virgibacillus sp. NKC19-3]MBY7144885.1 superoxide dismutase family protein [Virgibacillus sp. NKC19-3]
MRRWIMIIFILVLAVILPACGGNAEEQEDQDQETQPEENTDEESEQTNAMDEEEKLVSLSDQDGDVVGTATLTEGESGVTIEFEGTDLPAGTHGFHIHENPSCDPSEDFESAGEHFNPTEANHGFDDPDGPHAGDLPNMEVREDGTVEEEVTADMVTLEKDQDHSLYANGGTALMIHSDADDYTSQPSGDAGDRIACGVIEE